MVLSTPGHLNIALFQAYGEVLKPCYFGHFVSILSQLPTVANGRHGVGAWRAWACWLATGPDWHDETIRAPPRCDLKPPHATMQFHWSVCCDGYKKQHKFHEKSIFLTNEYWSRWKTKQGGFVELHLTDTHIKKYLGFDLFRACVCIFSVEMNCLQNYVACEKA